MSLKQIDKIQIVTLQDNYIDLLARDNNAVVTRAMLLKDNEIKNSLLAEHGFCALVTVTRGDEERTLLFDFGFSPHGAAFNADAMGLDLSKVETCVLSHGHLDHTGGIEALSARIGKQVPLVLHPEAFRNPRYIKFSEQFKVYFPPFTRQTVEKSNLSLVEAKKPYPILGDAVLYLGEIPRVTDFEKGVPNFYYQKDGTETWDDIMDDSAIVVNVKDKGIVVLSGCAHAGIVNTVLYAKKVTGIDKVHAVIGGFHLSGPDMEPIVEKTTKQLMRMNPTYLVPAHCTGRSAAMTMERDMPDRFILSMCGTKLTF